MLKKIAHNSTIPALGGNRDLKALQNLIAAEKVVLISLQRLSVDYSKASEALRTWGLTEGDYLGGILSASTSILNHFSSALSQYAAHGHSMRDQLKAIRTKEEALDVLERRRRSIVRKAEDADKKLSKMTPENKYFTLQRDTLNNLRDDIQALNSDIMAEEAALDKFKRSATKVWMGLKFGGLVECCQKGTIAGEFGRLAIAEISEEMSQPGLPRSFTYPQNKIEDYVAEAYRGVNMVTLSTFPSAELSDRGQYDLTSSDTPPAAFHISVPTEYGATSNNRLSMTAELEPSLTSNEASAAPPPRTFNDDNNANHQSNRPFGDGDGYSPPNSSLFQMLPSSQQHAVNEGDVDNVRSISPQYQQQLSQTLSSSQQLGSNEGAVDNIGVNLLRSIGSPHPQQFSQGTVNPPFSQTLPPSQQPRVNGDDYGAIAHYTTAPYQQRLSQETTNSTNSSSFSQTLPSSRQLGANEGAVDDFGVNTHSTGPPYQQRFSQSSNSSFQTLPPYQQHIRVNEGALDNFGRNDRAAAPPYERQFSQGSDNSINSTSSQTLQQPQVYESVVDDIVPNVHSPHPQQVSQGNVNSSSFSQTLPPHQQPRVSDGGVGPNDRSTGSPHPRQFPQGIVNSSFSQTLPPPQQLRVNDGAVGPNDRSTGSPRPQQQFSQGIVNSSFSQTLSPSQQFRLNDGGVGPNDRYTASPHPQQFSQGTASSSFSHPLPPSQQNRANEGVAMDNFGPNVRPAHLQQGTVSHALLPSQQNRANEGAAVDNFGPNVRPTAHIQQGAISPLFSQTSPPSQQPRVNEDYSGANATSSHPQQFSQGTVNPSFSQTLPPSQQNRANEGAAVDNFGPNVRPAHLQQGTVSRVLLPSQQNRANEDYFDANAISSHPQQFSQETVNPSFSQTLPPSQQNRANESTVDNFGANIRPTAHIQQGTVSPLFSQTLPQSQQPRVNENDFGANHPTGPSHSQQISQGTVGPLFSQTLSPPPPPPQQLRVNEDDFGAGVRSTGPPHSQQFYQRTVNPSFSQTLPPSEQNRANDGDVNNFGSNVRPTAHSQQGTVSPLFSQTLPPPPPPQTRVNEGDFGANVRSTGPPHSQQFSQGTVNPSFSQTLPPSQQNRANDGAVDNFNSNVRPTAHLQQGTVSPLFSQTLPPSQQPRVNEDDFGASVRSTGSPHSQQYSQGTVNPSFPPTLSPYNQHREGARDNFGSNVRSTNPADSSSTAGGRISTFQAQTGSTEGYSLQDPFSGGRPPKGDSASVEKFDDLKSETKMAPWVNNQFNDILERPIIAEGSTKRSYTQPVNAGSGRSGSPMPITAPSRNNLKPSGLVNQWINNQESMYRSSIQSNLSSQTSMYQDAPVCEDSENGEPSPQNTVPFSASPPPATTTTTTTTALSSQSTNERDSRHVKFGGVEDVDQGIEKRVIGPRGSPENSEANRTEINRDPTHQAKPQASNLNENVNNLNNFASRRILPNITPLNSYAQAAYQTTPNLPTQQQALDMRVPPPPRLQALNNKPVDSQLPPRFQNPSSSIANPLPPRFSQISAPGGWNF